METHTALTLQEDDTALVNFLDLNMAFHHHPLLTYSQYLPVCCSGLRIRAQVPGLHGCALLDQTFV